MNMNYQNNYCSPLISRQKSNFIQKEQSIQYASKSPVYHQQHHSYVNVSPNQNTTNTYVNQFLHQTSKPKLKSVQITNYTHRSNNSSSFIQPHHRDNSYSNVNEKSPSSHNRKVSQIPFCQGTWQPEENSQMNSYRSTSKIQVTQQQYFKNYPTNQNNNNLFEKQMIKSQYNNNNDNRDRQSQYSQYSNNNNNENRYNEGSRNLFQKHLQTLDSQFTNQQQMAGSYIGSQFGFQYGSTMGSQRNYNQSPNIIKNDNSMHKIQNSVYRQHTQNQTINTCQSPVIYKQPQLAKKIHYQTKNSANSNLRTFETVINQSRNDNKDSYSKGQLTSGRNNDENNFNFSNIGSIASKNDMSYSKYNTITNVENPSKSPRQIKRKFSKSPQNNNQYIQPKIKTNSKPSAVHHMTFNSICDKEQAPQVNMENVQELFNNYTVKEEQVLDDTPKKKYDGNCNDQECINMQLVNKFNSKKQSKVTIIETSQEEIYYDDDTVKMNQSEQGSIFKHSSQIQSIESKFSSQQVSPREVQKTPLDSYDKEINNQKEIINIQNQTIQQIKELQLIEEQEQKQKEQEIIQEQLKKQEEQLRVQQELFQKEMQRQKDLEIQREKEQQEILKKQLEKQQYEQEIKDKQQNLMMEELLKEKQRLEQQLLKKEQQDLEKIRREEELQINTQIEIESPKKKTTDSYDKELSKQQEIIDLQNYEIQQIKEQQQMEEEKQLKQAKLLEQQIIQDQQKKKEEQLKLQQVYFQQEIQRQKDLEIQKEKEQQEILKRQFEKQQEEQTIKEMQQNQMLEELMKEKLKIEKQLIQKEQDDQEKIKKFEEEQKLMKQQWNQILTNLKSQSQIELSDMNSNCQIKSPDPQASVGQLIKNLNIDGSSNRNLMTEFDHQVESSNKKMESSQLSMNIKYRNLSKEVNDFQKSNSIKKQQRPSSILMNSSILMDKSYKSEQKKKPKKNISFNDTPQINQIERDTSYHLRSVSTNVSQKKNNNSRNGLKNLRINSINRDLEETPKRNTPRFNSGKKTMNFLQFKQQAASDS